MTGWRVGYAIGPKELITYMNKVHQNMSTCATSFVQVGATAAFLHGKSFTEEMVKEFRVRRNLIMDGLSQVKGIDFVTPKGAFYIFPRIEKLGVPSTEFCSRVLENTGVAMGPGNAFGSAGEGFIRLAYACSRDEIVTAMEKLKDYVNQNY